ncbi:MAG: rRNA pseudouridine synthase [Clostridia bacterium]|nr:rRNA pseudouridine synthase [Clostridia bacterium]
MRINKFLAENGVASRRNADKLIESGEVTINGKPCTLGAEVKDGDVVQVNGAKITANTKKEYYIMNKPKGYVCTVSDDKGRPTVMDLLPAGVGRLFPVGRLDYDTEGLLLLTNDGDLTFRLTHPKNEVPKTYLIRVEGDISAQAIAKLRSGVEIDGVKTQKSNVHVVESTDDYTKLHVTITEGRNRQVRKMFESVGKEVVFLKRIKIGELTLRGLDRGKVRKLSPEEIHYLQHI